MIIVVVYLKTMTTYLTYFSSILSIVERTIKTFIVEESLLPVWSVVDKEKCKDMNLDRVNFIGRPIISDDFVIYIMADDNAV